MSNPYHVLRGASRLFRPRVGYFAPRAPVFPISTRSAHSPAVKKKKRKNKLQKMDDKFDLPFTEDQINDPDTIPISFYAEDPTSPTGERLLRSVETPEERREYNEYYKMHLEAQRNPDREHPELDRQVMNELMKDPEYASVTRELQYIRDNLHKATDEQQGLRDGLQEMASDPAFENVREEVENLQGVLDKGAGENDEEYKAATKAMWEKILEDPSATQGVLKMKDQWNAATEMTEDQYREQSEELDKLMAQMSDILGSMGNDDATSEIQADLNKLINEDPLAAEQEEDEPDGKEMTLEELSAELFELAQNPNGGVKTFSKYDNLDKLEKLNGLNEPEDSDEPVDPELEKKVDKIMQDPKLMEKLMYIQKVIAEEELSNPHINIPHELAPDPLELPPEQITTMGQRLRVAKSDPEHIAALETLRVNLLPPFNVSPTLRLFNEAIEYAYVGQNDDIRRILWRAYSKARTLPTFLLNLSDDAWDILYYSQAVTWSRNQNRKAHLKLLLRDLASVGKDGPPTHPSALADK